MDHEIRCTAASYLSVSGLTPDEMSARATAERQRRKTLRLREENGEIESEGPERPAYLSGIGQVFTELESYISHMQILLRRYRQQQLDTVASVSKTAERDILGAMSSLGSASNSLNDARGFLVKPFLDDWARSNSWTFGVYHYLVSDFESAVKVYSECTLPSVPVKNSVQGLSREPSYSQPASSPSGYRAPKHIPAGGWPPEYVVVDVGSAVQSGPSSTNVSAAAGQPASVSSKSEVVLSDSFQAIEAQSQH